ncbi:hypothetical protein EUTSA_v10006025mg [Eutrema salsugineum]|uniref:Stress response NST1-like protein n=1 Tax=Eutrema salsugineum TaxID=72664 RepID=V4L0M6_EUTSA|nr:uncharacterized protein LOC18020292 [Eutrema salsugineum]ESQ43815.1 hypothetical protein EUTSA_v10006025mg [Eutrema salsugineum]
MVVVKSFGHGEPETVDFSETPRFSDDLGSACSTPFVSAPSSPGRGPPPGYFFSAPSSPMHFFLCSAAPSENPKLDSSSSGDFEFDFSSRLSSSSGPLGGVSMTSAEELFSNGQIKPMKLSSHLQRPQILAPLLDLEEDEDDAKPDGGVNRRGRDLKLRSRSIHRKARSLSPLRNAAYQWTEEEEEEEEEEGVAGEREVKECIRKLQEDYENEAKSNENVPSAETTPSCSASSSRSSSYGRNSKKWIFLKDLLHRSKSEGRGNGKEKFWSNISFSPSNFKDKKLKSQPLTISKEEKPIPETENVSVELKKQKQKQPPAKKSPIAGKPTNGIAKRRGLQPSAHELHYTTNRAQAEEMKKRTYLPYRHGLFGCLGFSSKGYSALNGLARSLNPVSSG